MDLPRQEMINALKEKDKRNIKKCPKCGGIATKKSGNVMVGSNKWVGLVLHKCIKCGHEW